MLSHQVGLTSVLLIIFLIRLFLSGVPDVEEHEKNHQE